MQSPTFLKNENVLETFAHATSALSLESLMLDIRNLKGTLGVLQTDADTDSRTITFVYMNEQDVSKVLNMLPL